MVRENEVNTFAPLPGLSLVELLCFVRRDGKMCIAVRACSSAARTPQINLLRKFYGVNFPADFVVRKNLGEWFSGRTRS